MFNLTGEIALVTGAARGLGLAQARALASVGAEVIVSDHDTNTSRTAAETLCAEGFTATSLPMDVRDVSQIRSAFEHLEINGKVPSILLNNAGVSFRRSALEATEEDYDRTFSVNSRGAYFVAQTAARLMRTRGGGSIINIASIGALTVDGPQSSVYDSSKAAIEHVTGNFAYEWAQYGIRVNAIAPGYIHTSMIEGLIPDTAGEEELVQTKIPLGRVGEPEDLAGAVVFLASRESSWVTGHTLVVDGGWMAAY
ncbi:SDR family NAD(P)-dependent oxidoreductase [Corynebacterium sp. AOP40-9SA-29]|uniref:SDR family NAD(P)-dependent oxidoreductase n=1 Tax=Corynebacterium sp. AOP40-9SA-29 TaxID=3457677 RepID=UPI004034E7C7